ncbi:MAG: 4-alpha-glucanotransferase [Candidatus Aureabacteria bacterium]|nr:4-alpha-glucanotransferase [Candidatus Auribacterota bacterium]
MLNRICFSSILLLLFYSFCGSISSEPDSGYFSQSSSCLSPKLQTGSIELLSEFIGNCLGILPEDPSERKQKIGEIARQLRTFYFIKDIKSDSVTAIRRQGTEAFTISVESGSTYTFSLTLQPLPSEKLVQELKLDHGPAHVVKAHDGFYKFDGTIYSTSANEPVKVKVAVKKSQKEKDAVLYVHTGETFIPLQKVSSRDNTDFYETDLVFPQAGMYSYQIIAGDGIDGESGKVINELVSHKVFVKVDPAWSRGVNVYDSIHLKMVRNPEIGLDPSRFGTFTDAKWLVEQKIKIGCQLFKFLPLTHSGGKSPYSPVSSYMPNPENIDWKEVEDEGETPDEKAGHFWAQYDKTEEGEYTERQRKFRDFTSRNFVVEYAIYNTLRDLEHPMPITMGGMLLGNISITLNDAFKELARTKQMDKLMQIPQFRTLYRKNLYLAFNAYTQLKDLIDFIHAKGGRICIDKPFFLSRNSVETFFHRELIKSTPNGDMLSPSFGNPGDPSYQYWGDLVFPDFEKMKGSHYDFYLDPLSFWIDDLGVDAMRWDAAHYAPLEVWDELGKRIQGKDVYILGEQLGGAWEKDYPGKIYGIHVYENNECNAKDPVNFEKYLEWVCRNRDYPMHSSHDSFKVADFDNEHQRYGCFAAEDPREMQVKAVLTQFAMGAPIFAFQMGDEYLSRHRIHQPGQPSEWNERSYWDPEINKEGHDISDYLEKLNRMRKENPALQELNNFEAVGNNKKNEGVSSFIRHSKDKENILLTLNNLSGKEHSGEVFVPFGDLGVDAREGFTLTNLLTGEEIEFTAGKNLSPDKNVITFTLKPGEAVVFELSAIRRQNGSYMDKWLRRNLYSKFGFSDPQMDQLVSLDLLNKANNDPARVIALLSRFSFEEIMSNIGELITRITQEDIDELTRVWTFDDKNKVAMPKENQWLLVKTKEANNTQLGRKGKDDIEAASDAIRIGDEYYSLISPRQTGDYWLTFTWGLRPESVKYHLKVLPNFENIKDEIVGPDDFPSEIITRADLERIPADAEVTLANGKGAISRIPLRGIHLEGENMRGYISKYDGELLGNLSTRFPEDRKLIVKGSHAVVKIDGVDHQLNDSTFYQFQRYPFPVWQYKIGEGENEVIIERTVSMVRKENNTVSNYRIVKAPPGKRVTLYVRPHLAMRSFHENTKASSHEMKEHWQRSCWAIDIGENGKGVGFNPVGTGWGDNYRGTYVMANKGKYNMDHHWWFNVMLPKEEARGQDHTEDVFSPGFFEIDLGDGESVDISSAMASYDDQLPQNRAGFYSSQSMENKRQEEMARQRNLYAAIPNVAARQDGFVRKLVTATDLFICDRDDHKTVIAGYPWFTDWGRDTFIVVMGMLKAGMFEDVKDIILQFSQFEEFGTLPNIIHGEEAGNRDTVDAPVWMFEIIRQYMEMTGEKILDEILPVRHNAREIRDNPRFLEKGELDSVTLPNWFVDNIEGLLPAVYHEEQRQKLEGWGDAQAIKMVSTTTFTKEQFLKLVKEEDPSKALERLNQCIQCIHILAASKAIQNEQERNGYRDNVLNCMKIVLKRDVRGVLKSIVQNYIRGTPNGIQMDMQSCLVYCPPHYTWMDTNFPACTPREGYPLEIQALWCKALDFLTGHEPPGDARNFYSKTAETARKSFNDLFWDEKDGYLYDNLRAARKEGALGSASQAEKDPAFRSNQSIPILLGLVDREKAQRVVTAMYQKLVMPGGIRSLAEGSGSIDGFGFEGWYAGDEDSKRKRAYHNGTAWTFPLAQFMLAYAKAFDYSKKSIEEMLVLFETVKEHLREAGIGNISEIMDGNAPHITRGCDEQAWGASEFLRAYIVLKYEYHKSYQDAAGKMDELMEPQNKNFAAWQEALSKISSPVHYEITFTKKEGEQQVSLSIPSTGNQEEDAVMAAYYVKLYLVQNKLNFRKITPVEVKLNGAVSLSLSGSVQSYLKRGLAVLEGFYQERILPASA